MKPRHSPSRAPTGSAGGSSDGTLQILRGADGVTLLEEPGANIARGRNVAIAAATHDIIAVSDADCVLAPDWLEGLPSVRVLTKAQNEGLVAGRNDALPLVSGRFVLMLDSDTEVRPGTIPPGH